MKNFRLALLLLTSVICGTLFFTAMGINKLAYANEETFLRVINHTTTLYKDADCTIPLTFLPYTYYVKVLEKNTSTYHVEFGTNNAPAVDGYVKTGQLFYDGLKVENPYPRLSVTTLSTATLYSDLNCATPIQYVFEKRELQYYGNYQNLSGKQVCMVYYNGKVGYVAEETIEPFNLPLHANPLSFLPPKDTKPESDTPVFSEQSNNDGKAVKIAVIGCLIVAGVIALIISLRPKPKSTPTSYYDENDFN